MNENQFFSFSDDNNEFKNGETDDDEDDMAEWDETTLIAMLQEE